MMKYSKTIKINLICFCICFCVKIIAHAQLGLYNPQLPYTVTPETYQFIKNGHLPVSEYAGTPAIKIPLYVVKNGDIELPLTLQYNSGGIRVTEEASWVGLGWNLQLGNIIQLVNDRDDLADFEKVLPDYVQYYGPPGYPMEMYYLHLLWGFPYTYTYYPSDGMSQTDPIHSYVIYSNYYVPIDNVYENTRYPMFFNAMGWPGADWNTVDSEPDVFKVSALGHTFSFIMDLKTEEIVSLNKKYKVFRISGNNWKIIAPDGTGFYFEEYNETRNLSNYKACPGASGTIDNYLISRIWHLTKIESPLTKEIKINYTSKITNIHSLRESGNEVTLKDRVDDGVPVTSGSFPAVKGINSFTGDQTCESYSDAVYEKSYISSIISSNCSISFNLGIREDIADEKRLNSITVYSINSSTETEVKNIDFGYEYFNSDSTAGNFYECNFKSSEEKSKRLKLVSLSEPGINPYIFRYSDIDLPYKTSYACDMWGYYNGNHANTSFLPNPIRFGYTDLGDNGNNKSANSNFAEAGLLTKITYPTGGESRYTYELNEFTVGDDEDAVPDYDGTLSLNVKGNGLRINDVSLYESNTLQSVKNYTYTGGIMFVPQKYFHSWDFRELEIYTIPGFGSGLEPIEIETGRMIYEIEATKYSASNFYAPSLFGSGNFVGYSQVEIEEFGSLGNSNGRVVKNFNNNKDISGRWELETIRLSAYKDLNHSNPSENGSLLSEIVYNVDNKRVKQAAYSYDYIHSDIYYGAKTAFYGIKGYMQGLGAANMEWHYYEQDMVGYYPIFSGETFLTGKGITTYFYDNDGTQRTIYTSEGYSYIDGYRLLRSKTSSGSVSSAQTTYYYPEDYNASGNIYEEMLEPENNMMAAVVKEQVTDLASGDNIDGFEYSYTEPYDGLFVPTTVNKLATDNTYTWFQTLNYSEQGNIISHTSNKEPSTGYVWGYQHAHPIAKVENAKANEIFFDSFEDGLDGYHGTSTTTQKYNGEYSYSLDPDAGWITFCHKTIDRADLSDMYTYSAMYLSSTSSSTRIGNIGYKITDEDDNTLEEYSWFIFGTDDSWKFFEKELDMARIKGENPGVNNFKIQMLSYNIPDNPIYLDDFRFHPSDAQMTTYTYKPLIGVTSITDPNHKTTRYYYDSFGRLEQIKDHDGAIIEKYKYNYAEE